MNALIVEDEVAAQRNLTSVLAAVAPHVKVVAITDSITETVEWILASPSPDVIFMDIHLADGHAFNIFDIVNIQAPVIFTTAFDRYALEAFRLNGIDYLLKPIVPHEVVRALDKLRLLCNQTLIDNLKQHICINDNKPILVHFRDKLIPVKQAEIAFAYTANEHVHLTLHDGRCLSYERSLDSLMLRLAPDNFYRANRQFIVARKAIRDVDVWTGNRLSVNLRVNIPERILISKNRVAAFKEWLAS